MASNATIEAASARADVRALALALRRRQAAARTKPAAPGAVSGRKLSGIMVPRFKDMIRWDEYMWRELREGGVLKRYLDHERATSPRRQRAVARRMSSFRQNNKSDLRLVAAVPAREFMRWKQEDPDFWLDDKNLKSLRRDNPDMCIYV